MEGSVQGLTCKEALARLKKYGYNVLVEQPKKQVFLSFLSRFTNPLILILLAASLVSALTYEFVNFILIFSMVLASATIDFLQEYQSGKAEEKLKSKVAVNATVIRDGERREVLMSRLTIGDVVVLSAGDTVPAELDVFDCKDLHIDESTLTGESFPVEKHKGDEVLMGTSVVNGTGLGVVAKIGKDTRVGAISESLVKQRPRTDFEKGILGFGLLITKITVVLVVFIFVVNFGTRHDFLGSLLFAVALAVGLTPELLPMIVTANLSRGASRMFKKGVIVKHLPAIQNFGSMDVLCTDKTGTITENRIKLEKYEDVYSRESRKVLEYAYLNSFNQSNLRNPLDEAILAHREAANTDFRKLDEIPFDFTRKRLSVVVQNAANSPLLICKGAFENILMEANRFEVNGRSYLLDEGTKGRIIKRCSYLSAEGYRVLAVSYKQVGSKDVYSKEDEKGLTFLGLTAFYDPPKRAVKGVLDKLAGDGIGLKILTGDNELVTRKVCSDLDIKIYGVVNGPDIKSFSREVFKKKVLFANIFVRLTPEQKEDIVTILRENKCVVGYLGDGINDASSLKSADIGISVDNATDVAKESADIILLNKSLAVLEEGVLEGRKTFANVFKYIFVGMGSNLGNMVSLSVVSIFLPFLPLLPIQILLNNLLYDLSQVTIPLDFVDLGKIRNPQKWDMNFIKSFVFIFGPISSVFDFITFYVLLRYFNFSIPLFRTGWFVESIVTQSLIILSLRTQAVPFFMSRPSFALATSVVLAAVFGTTITQAHVGALFGFAPLPFNFWIFLVVVTGLYFLSVEVAKKFFYKRWS